MSTAADKKTIDVSNLPPPSGPPPARQQVRIACLKVACEMRTGQGGTEQVIANAKAFENYVLGGTWNVKPADAGTVFPVDPDEVLKDR